MGTPFTRIAAAALFSLLPAGAAPPLISAFDRADQLKAEPVDSIRLVFQQEDPRLYWTQVYEKLPIDETSSIMLVEAAPLIDTQRPGHMNPDRTQSRFGLFAVSGPGNRVQSTLDIFRPPFEYAIPELEPPTPETVYIHWHGHYGAYINSLRYDYRSSSRLRAKKSEYGRFSVKFSAADGPRLYFHASFANLHPSRLTTQNAGLIFDTETREFTITSTPPAPIPAQPAPSWVASRLHATPGAESAMGGPIRLRSGLWALITGAGLQLLTPGNDPSFYPNPATTPRHLAELRPELSKRGQPADKFIPNSGFGPLAIRGPALWFLNTFYDGEGYAGAGFIGRITPGEPTVEIRHLPEIACCSGSALYVPAEGEETVYAGLVTRPEGALAGRGLFRYHPASGETRHFPIPFVIQDIRAAGNALALATEHGLYLLEDDTLAHYRLEPAPEGGLEIVTLALPEPNSP